MQAGSQSEGEQKILEMLFVRLLNPSLSQSLKREKINKHEEFDPGSGRTLAAGLIHASRTRKALRSLVKWRKGE